MLLCERVALPACVVSSLQVWHTLRILALLASASIIVALGRVSASHTAVHMPPARWFSRGALGWPLNSSSSASKKASGTRQDIPADLSLPSHTHPCCCRRKTAVQLQTVSFPTLVIVYAQLLSGCVAVLSLRLHRGPCRYWAGCSATQSPRAGALRAGTTTIAAPPRSPALARLPGSAREITCRCSVHHVSSQVVLSAAIVSAQLVSVRRRHRRLEDTCAQRGGRALRMSLGWG